jgi:hypothetical protein
MKLSLQSYFDAGASFGLGDDVFRATPTTAVPNILEIGIRNPLGQGIVCRLRDTDPALVRLWTERAVATVAFEHMDEDVLGYRRDRTSPTRSGPATSRASRRSWPSASAGTRSTPAT